jgi:hypothetical protein
LFSEFVDALEIRFSGTKYLDHYQSFDNLGDVGLFSSFVYLSHGSLLFGDGIDHPSPSINLEGSPILAFHRGHECVDGVFDRTV